MELGLLPNFDRGSAETNGAATCNMTSERNCPLATATFNSRTGLGQGHKENSEERLGACHRNSTDHRRNEYTVVVTVVPSAYPSRRVEPAVIIHIRIPKMSLAYSSQFLLHIAACHIHIPANYR